MPSLSTLLHLRIPFSFFLMPVFFFALANSPNFTETGIVWTFLIVHFLLYPASNGFNSYFDKDEKSIGGLKNPPPVKKELYYVSLAFDLTAILFALKISFLFSLMILVYGLVSKAYSHPSVRLKKYPIVGWLVTGFFQGFFSFLMCYEGINALGVSSLLKLQLLIPAILTSVMLWGNYPMTQIYQHDEDEKHGDKTLSIVLGIMGTFIFTALVFSLATAGFVIYFIYYSKIDYAIQFVIALSPVLIYFLIWFYQVVKDSKKASYGRTMWLNFISAFCLNGFFIYLFLDSTQVIQAIESGF
jgi:1,4-dihydroxy-2-naphthoate octaprenyltransferase